MQLWGSGLGNTRTFGKERMIILENLQDCRRGKEKSLNLEIKTDETKPHTDSNWGEKRLQALYRRQLHTSLERNTGSSFKRHCLESNPVDTSCRDTNTCFLFFSAIFPVLAQCGFEHNGTENGVFCWFSINTFTVSGSHNQVTQKRRRKLLSA